MTETAPAPSRFPKPLRRGAACLNCRRSKQACDAVRPECGSCTLRGRECTYAPFFGPIRKRQQKVLELESQLNDQLVTESDSTSGSARTGSSVTSADTSSQSGGTTDGTSPPSDYASQCDAPKGLLQNMASNEPPSLDSEFPAQMLQAFLPYRDHFGMDMDAQRWMWVVTLPTSHPEAMHPALLNAICVIGCSLDPSIPKSWERHFYASAREQMQLSLSLCDRIEDWLYTVAILIGYLLLRGRPRGMVELSHAAIPIAVACNMHQLGKPTDFATQSYGLLTPARDAMHANDRINLWWALWLMDKRGAIAVDIPQAFPYRDTETVTTPMPVARSTIEAVGLKLCSWKTLPDTLKPPHSAMDVSGDSAVGLRVKSTFILSEAVRTANGTVGRHGIMDWTDIPTMDAMITAFLDSTPNNETAYSIVSDVPLSPLLARTTLSCLCSAVILFGIGADNDPVIYARRLSAARWMASLYREIQSYQIYPYRYICNAPFWACGRGVIEEELERTRESDEPIFPQASKMAYMDTLVEELKWMNSHLVSEDAIMKELSMQIFEM